MGDTQKGNVIVVGCRGFIGSAIYTQLRKNYGRRVQGVSSADVDLRKANSVQKLGFFFHRSARVVAVSGITPEQDDTLQAFNDNLKITNHLAQALVRFPVRQCVYLSTVSVYGRGPKRKPITERTPLHPDSLYRIAKFVGEELLGQAARSAGTQYLILRLPRVYGPLDQHSIYGPSAFVRAIESGKPVRLFGDGKERRAFLYVGDLARIVEKLLGSNAEGVVNVAPSQSERFVDVVAAIENASGRGVRVVRVPRSGAKYDEQYQIRRLRTLLPGFQFTSLEKGVRATWQARASQNTKREVR